MFSVMDRFACALIDALGGTAKVAQAMHAPASTVSNMRSHLTTSRLNHLRRIAKQDHPGLDIEALAAEYGVELLPIPEPERQSPGSSSAISRLVAPEASAVEDNGDAPPFRNLPRGTVQTAPGASREIAGKYVGTNAEAVTNATNSSANSSELCGGSSTNNAFAEVVA